MKIVFSKPFVKDYHRQTPQIQQQIDRQIERLVENPRHPSLQMKKMEGHQSIWEARITEGYRMTFQIDSDTYVFRRAGTHDILKKP